MEVDFCGNYFVIYVYMQLYSLIMRCFGLRYYMIIVYLECIYFTFAFIVVVLIYMCSGLQLMIIFLFFPFLDFIYFIMLPGLMSISVWHEEQLQTVSV